MKQLQKFMCLMGLAIIANSLMSTHVYAEETEEGSLKIIGTFELGSFYDFKPYGANDTFSPAAIPLTENKDCKRTLGLKILSAALGLKKKFPLGDNSEVIEFVIQSKLSTEALKLKRIYIDHDNFRVGLAVNNFCDLSALPNTLFGLPGAAPAPANTIQLGWKDILDSGLSYGIAAEQALALEVYPKEKEKTIEKASENFTAINNIPAVSAHVKYEETFGYVRLGGLFRTLDYKDKTKTHYTPAGGVNLTAVFNLRPDQTTLKLGGVYGIGIGSYLVDLASAHDKELKDVYEHNDKLVLIGTQGAYIGLEHHWLPKKLRSAFALGFLDTTDSQDRGSDAYKQGHYASTNLTYHPTDNLMVGVEYMYGKRLTITDKKGKDAHRIQAAVGFTL